MEIYFSTNEPSIVEKIINPNSRPKRELILMDEHGKYLRFSMKEAKRLKNWLNKNG